MHWLQFRSHSKLTSFRCTHRTLRPNIRPTLTDHFYCSAHFIPQKHSIPPSTRRFIPKPSNLALRKINPLQPTPHHRETVYTQALDHKIARLRSSISSASSQVKQGRKGKSTAGLAHHTPKEGYWNWPNSRRDEEGDDVPAGRSTKEVYRHALFGGKSRDRAAMPLRRAAGVLFVGKVYWLRDALRFDFCCRVSWIFGWMEL